MSTLLTVKIPALKKYAEPLYDLLHDGKATYGPVTLALDKHINALPQIEWRGDCLYAHWSEEQDRILTLALTETEDSKELFAVWRGGRLIVKGLMLSWDGDMNPEVSYAADCVELSWNSPVRVSIEEHKLIGVNLSSIYLFRDKAVLHLKKFPDVTITW